MSIGNYSITTRAIGTILTASIYNADHQNHVTNQNPQGTGAYSDTVAQMQAITDPGGVGTESVATSLAGELERLRFIIKNLVQNLDAPRTQWYDKPTTHVVVKELFTAKGDILVATGNAAVTNVPMTVVDGLALVSDSTQAAGVKWGASGTTLGILLALSQGFPTMP